MSASTLVIYHGDCVDGYTAAWAVKIALGHDPAIDFYAANYGQPPVSVEGRKRVYLVDFAYDRETIMRMADQVPALIVLDHHKTAEAALRGLPYCTFDMERSGAGIAWDELVKRERPWLVNYVEDRDLWKFKLPGSKEVNAYIRSCEKTFARWDALSRTDLRTVAAAGDGCQAHIDAYVRAAVKHARMVKFGGQAMPLVNVTYESCSEVADRLLEEYPEVPVAGYWFERGDGRFQYGFRSRPTFDCGEFAKQFGGGGHMQAAGCVVERPLHW